MQKIYILIATFFTLYSTHSSAAITPNSASYYFDCRARGGLATEARFVLNESGLGGMIFTFEHGPLSYLNGRDSEVVELYKSDQTQQFIITLRNAVNHSIPEVTAFIEPDPEQDRFFLLKLYILESGQATYQTGSCIGIQH